VEGGRTGNRSRHKENTEIRKCVKMGSLDKICWEE
jgi:hypothetical protein